MIINFIFTANPAINMWNDIEILANDDTGSCRLNIDSRQESGTSLYQVDTLLKIASTEKVRLFFCKRHIEYQV